MNKYWVALESGVVKINKFKRAEKKERRKGLRLQQLGTVGKKEKICAGFLGL